MAPLSHSGYNDDGVRLQALIMVECGMPLEEITCITGVTRSTIYRLKKKARERGYVPNISRALKLEQVTDNPLSRSPRKRSSNSGGIGKVGPLWPREGCMDAAMMLARLEFCLLHAH